MSAQQIRDNLVLGVLELSPAPLNAELIAENFDANAERAAECLDSLEASDLVERVADGYFVPTKQGSEHVVTRGASPA